jgi:hypothetical protein
VYALVRKAKLAVPGIAEDAAQRVREGAVPLLRDQPGFRLHVGFVSEAGEAVGASLFDDRRAALAALGRLRAWAAASMADLTLGERHPLHRRRHERRHVVRRQPVLGIRRQQERLVPAERNELRHARQTRRFQA